MKTLAVGAAALVCAAAFGLSAAVPAAADPPAPPTVRATCKILEVDVDGTYEGTGYVLAIGYGFAENGDPGLGTDVRNQDGESLVLDQSKAFRWHVQLTGPDGGVVWDQSGTTTPCVPAILGHAQPVVPPVPPCGSTLDDVAWPTTPGIVYTHDQWNGYAHLQPGWEWVNSNFDPATGWWLKGSSIESDLAWLPRDKLLDPTGHCREYVPPPMSSSVNGPCWSGEANPQPCPSPQTVRSRTSSTAAPTTTATAKPASAAAAPATVPPSTGVTAAPTVPPPSPTPSPHPTPAVSAAPSPTPTASASQRVATGTGLGIAGGVAGACVLATAGAFVVRTRLRLRPTEVLLDESGPEPGPDGPGGTTD